MKNRLGTIAVAILVVLTMLQMAIASQPIPVAGNVIFTSFTPIDVKKVDGNTITDFKQTTDVTGNFTGSEEQFGTLVQHSAGDFNFKIRSTFTGTVNGKSGTLVLKVVGNGEGGVPGGTARGKFVILSGTGELANLHGEGIVEGIAGVGLNYSGQIHFDPN